MSDLSQFSGSELELLASLPYKVGVFISHADDVDGESDDEREMAALELCLKAIAKAHEDKPFTAAVMKQSLTMRPEWPRWADRSFRVCDEAEMAAALLSTKLDEDALKDFKRALMRIARTVAQAHGEFGQFDDESDKGGVFGAFVNKFVGGFAKDDADQPMNVSAAEEAAIHQLRASLQ